MFIKTIGKGYYSKVKLVINRQDGKRYVIVSYQAAKIINKSQLKARKSSLEEDENGNLVRDNLLEDAVSEISILKELDHPNIIKLYEIINHEDEDKIYLSE